jgi:hypothetical protein
VGTCELMHQDFISKSYTQEWQSNAYKKLDRPMVELPTDGIAFVNDLVERDYGERLRLPHCTEGKRLRRVGFYPGISACQGQQQCWGRGRSLPGFAP